MFETCDGVLRKPFGFTLLSARRGSSWSWVLGPVRAIVAAQTYLGQEVM